MMRLLRKQLWLTPHLFGISSSPELAHITEFSRQLKLSYVRSSNGLLTMVSGNISEVHSAVSWPPCTEAEETALLWMALAAGLRSLSPEHLGLTQQNSPVPRRPVAFCNFTTVPLVHVTCPQVGRGSAMSP